MHVLVMRLAVLVLVVREISPNFSSLTPSFMVHRSKMWHSYGVHSIIAYYDTYTY